MTDGFQTASTLEPAGQPEDENTTTCHPIDRTDALNGMMGRDAQVDSGRMGASSDQKEDAGWQVDVGVTVIAEEKENQGWDKLARPSGAAPNPVSTAGTRGASDIQRWPQDADQSGDSGSGYGDTA